MSGHTGTVWTIMVSHLLLFVNRFLKILHNIFRNNYSAKHQKTVDKSPPPLYNNQAFARVLEW